MQNSNQPPNNSRVTIGMWLFFLFTVASVITCSSLAFKVSNSLPGAIFGGMGVYLAIFATNNHFMHIHDLIAEAVAHAFDWLFTQTRIQLRDSAADIAVLILCLFLLRLLLSLLPLPLIFVTTINIDHCDHYLNTDIHNHAETIGLSTGCIVFDTGRPDGKTKMQVAALFLHGQIQKGVKGLEKEHLQDSSDAELVIYAANKKVEFTVHGGHNTITIVNIIVATILTGKYAYIGREELQGVATAQQEFNQGNKAVQLIVTIANMGSDEDNVMPVVGQIVKATTRSSSIIGIIGPPFCSQTKTLVDILKAKNVGIPIISPDASCDNLTSYSPELYHIAPSNLIQAEVATWYLQKVLHATYVVIFTNKANTDDTFDQAKDFMKLFPLQTIVEPYEPGNTQKILAGLQDAMQSKPLPDAFLFTGTSDDLNTLLAHLPTTGPFAHIPVVGFDPLYSLGGYNQTNQQMRTNFQRLRLVSLFFPDEATFLKEKPPALLADYSMLFDPDNIHPDGIYGFSRMDSAVALTYDATSILLSALPPQNTNITVKNILTELVNIAYDGAWQGATGQINFLDGTVPYEKAIVILTVDSNDKFHMVMLARGCYEKEHCQQTLHSIPDIALDQTSSIHGYVFFRKNKDNSLLSQVR